PCSSAWQVAQAIFFGVCWCGGVFTSVWQSTQVNMPPWMEALNLSGSTWRLSALPLTSCVKVASLWQARQSSAVGLGGSFLVAARSDAAVRTRVRTTPGAKNLSRIRVDILSPAYLLRLDRLSKAACVPGRPGTVTSPKLLFR